MRIILLISFLLGFHLSHSQVMLFHTVEEIESELFHQGHQFEKKQVVVMDDQGKKGKVPFIKMQSEELRVEYDFIPYYKEFRCSSTRVYPLNNEMLDLLKQVYSQRYTKISDGEWEDSTVENIKSRILLLKDQSGHEYFYWTFIFR